MGMSLPPDLDRLVQVKLALGVYRSEEEVLRAALGALDAQEETLAAISAGYADFEAGRYRLLDEADAEFRQQHNLPSAQ
jgi:predicted transcriptional regulator